MPDTTITLRQLEPRDREDWQRLWRGYLEFYESSVVDAVYESTFERLLLDHEQEPKCVLAEIDGEPVGLVHYMFHRHCWRIENVCYLQDLFADESVRGLGVGRTLIEAVYREADAAACPGVYWMTAEDNTTARLLYDRVATKTQFVKYQR